MSERDENFLARWSRRKSAARNAPADERAPDAPRAERVPDAPLVERVPSTPERMSPAMQGCNADPAAAAQDPIAALPPLESLTPDSDFAPFMNAGVDPGVKSRALKTLFSDPALYPMDGLDVYIDDYTQPDPLPAGWLERLNQFTTLHGEAPAREAEPAAAAATGAAPAVASSAETSEHVPSPQPSDTPAAQSVEGDSKNRGAI